MFANHAEEYEARRLLCLGGGGLGGILGTLGGIAGSFLAPELLPAFIPAALSAAGGGEVGGLLGGIAGGEKPGQAALGALPEAATAGIGTGLTNLATGGNFLGSVTPAAGVSSLFGGSGAAAGGTAPVTPVESAPLTSGAPSATLAPAAAGGSAPAAGAGAGVPVGGIASTTGASPGDISGALSTTPAGGGGSYFMGDLSDTTNAAPTTLTQSLGTAGPVTGTSLTTLGLPSSGSGTDLSASGIGSFDASGNPVPTGSTTATDFAGGSVPTTGSKLLSYLSSNPGLLLAGAGLTEALRQGNSIPGLGSLKTEAGLEATQGNQNLSALQTGQLPAGAQAAIDQATQAAKATTASEFARLGMTGSTSEAQADAGIEQAAAAQKFTDLSQVSQMGLNQLNAANSLYTTIMNTQLQQDQETQNAIARLAAALGGSTGAGSNYKLVAA